MKGREIRESFLRYFEERDHRRVRSSSLIPSGDPTLLFTNAGMVQFKDVFLGSEARDYRRATTAQKCVRAGGKHNDLENVGRTARHHTFFEMLGNFSFGDYFKEEAIPFAWEYLTRVVGLPKKDLWVTVFRDDDEAAGIWARQAGLPASRIVRLGEKDNFWAMGETGPCGPCSEIIVDQGPAMGCGRPGCAVGCDCDRYLEVWNLVFMQFNRDASGAVTPLPRPSIDTGMGLERLAAVLQGKHSNFDTDLFAPIIRFIEKASGARYGASAGSDVSIRVIADHLRATAFLISDGVIPSNEGRGYVLRRIMRRAGRHAYLLGLHETFIHKGVPVMVEAMGGAYPELAEHADYTARMMRQEEERFHATLEAGLGIIGEVVAELKKGRGTVIPGETIFRLYDTYGFPLDLAEDLAKDEGLALDLEGFKRLMEEQRERARAAWVGSGEEGAKESWRGVMEKLPATQADCSRPEMAGARVLAIVSGDRRVEAAGAGEKVEVFLDRTPFYGEAGGQVGDRGELEAEGARVVVSGARKAGQGHVVHLGEVAEGRLVVGRPVTARIDLERRQATARNHTATHLLQAALRQVLGDHVKQAGSLVAPDRLRFDFTHFGPLAPEEVHRVEELVNDTVLANIPLEKLRDLPLDEAVKSGATAIFGEKYGEKVTVVRVPGFSAELCGGTHVDRTGDIGLFRIVNESSVAAGVRRVEAVTGAGARESVRDQERVLRQLSALLKTGPEGLPERVERLQGELKALEKTAEKARHEAAGSKFDEILAGAREAGGVRVVAAQADGLPMDSLREMADRLKDKLGDAAVFLVSAHEGKLLMVAGSGGRAQGKVNAGKLVGQVAPLAGGKGGGRPDFAQAGAKDPAGAERVLAEARRLLDELLA